MHCIFTDAIGANVVWYKDGRQIQALYASPTFDGRTAQLVLKEANKSACGLYVCVVKNTEGEAKTEAVVSLKGIVLLFI